jgi:hypothetical protein
MYCYKHREESAIAICRYCGKATCADCCEDTGLGIACGAACAGELWEAYRLNNRQRQSYGIGPKPTIPASVSTYFFFGLILSLVGIYLTVTRPGTDFLTFAMAAVFFVMAAGSYKRYRDGCVECGSPGP